MCGRNYVQGRAYALEAATPVQEAALEVYDGNSRYAKVASLY
jgi:hypothetical protein